MTDTTIQQYLRSFIQELKFMTISEKHSNSNHCSFLGIKFSSSQDSIHGKKNTMNRPNSPTILEIRSFIQELQIHDYIKVTPNPREVPFHTLNRATIRRLCTLLFHAILGWVSLILNLFTYHKYINYKYINPMNNWSCKFWQLLYTA